jgi:hypothetical protein
MVCFGFCQVGGMPILSVCKSYLDYLFVRQLDYLLVSRQLVGAD